MTADEYLAWEREQPGRHEFFQGEVFAMAGGTMRHNALGVRLARVLDTQLQGRCTVFSSDQRVVGAQRGRYVYPDLSVVCGRVVTEPGTNDVLANPSIIIEVLSSGTAKYDHGTKWQTYQGIASLTDYVLVSQTAAQIEHFRRTGTGSWSYQSVGAGGRLVLSNEAVLDVDAVFAGIFDLPGDSPDEEPDPDARRD